MSLLLLGLVTGRRVLRRMEDLSGDLSAETRARLGLRRGVSDSALYELLCRLPAEGFRQVLTEQVRADLNRRRIQNDIFPGGLLTLDGKGAGSGPGEAPAQCFRTTTSDKEGTSWWHLYALRACLTSSSVRPVLDQEVIGDKSWEPSCFGGLFTRAVAAFPKLFRYVSTDAGMTSAANARLVLDAGKAYVFALKANLKRLFELADSLLANAPVIASTTDREKGATVVRELRRAKVPVNEKFPGARQFWSVRRTATRDDGTQEVEDRLFVTSIEWEELAPERMLQLVRLHWGIENGANWTADVILEEDTSSPCKHGEAVLVVSWLRLIAYNIVSCFRASSPWKDGRPITWARAMERLYQAIMLLGARPELAATNV